MSGGSYNYKFEEIQKLAEMLKPPKRRENDDIRERLSEALEEIAAECKRVEWIDSFDKGKESFIEVEKWLDKHNF